GSSTAPSRCFSAPCWRCSSLSCGPASGFPNGADGEGGVVETPGNPAAVVVGRLSGNCCGTHQSADENRPRQCHPGALSGPGAADRRQLPCLQPPLFLRRP